MLDGVLDRVGDAAIVAGLGMWALDRAGHAWLLPLTVAAVTGAMMSMATKDRGRLLGLPSAPERMIGWLLGGRDGRLLIITVLAIADLPVWALWAVATTSMVSLVLRVHFVRRVLPPSR
jgi:hypothetical protein